MKKTIILTMLIALGAAGGAYAGMDHDADHSEKTKMWFSKVDTNNDNMITKSEHDQFASQMFQKADADQNGNVSMDEFKAQKMREKSEMEYDKSDNIKDMKPESKE